MFNNNYNPQTAGNTNNYAKVQAFHRAADATPILNNNVMTKDQMKKMEEDAYAKKSGYDSFEKLIEARKQEDLDREYEKMLNMEEKN